MICSETLSPRGDVILLKKLVNRTDKKYGNIIIPHTHKQNNSLGIAEVCKIGTSENCKNSGLHVGNYVLYDFYSVYSHDSEYVITKLENIIMILSEEEKNSYIKNHVIQ